MALLYIIRGLPTSGKTTLAKTLVKNNYREADMFFIEDGVYKYDASKIKDAHDWCRQEIISLLSKEITCAVSNTFVRRWEYQPYIDIASFNKHQYSVIECHGSPDWKNTHDVPKNVIERMRASWEPHQ